MKLKCTVMTIAGVLLLGATAHAGNLEVTAFNATEVFMFKTLDWEEAAMKSEMDYDVRKRAGVMDFGWEHHFINIEVHNKTDKVVSINPNHFTLITDKGTAIPYSSSTHRMNSQVFFKDVIKELKAVELYPGSHTSGYLLFDRQETGPEKGETLYFKSGEHLIKVKVPMMKREKEKEGDK